MKLSTIQEEDDCSMCEKSLEGLEDANTRLMDTLRYNVADEKRKSKKCKEKIKEIKEIKEESNDCKKKLKEFSKQRSASKNRRIKPKRSKKIRKSKRSKKIRKPKRSKKIRKSKKVNRKKRTKRKQKQRGGGLMDLYSDIKDASHTASRIPIIIQNQLTIFLYGKKDIPQIIYLEKDSNFPKSQTKEYRNSILSKLPELSLAIKEKYPMVMPPTNEQIWQTLQEEAIDKVIRDHVIPPLDNKLIKMLTDTADSVKSSASDRNSMSSLSSVPSSQPMLSGSPYSSYNPYY